MKWPCAMLVLLVVAGAARAQDFGDGQLAAPELYAPPPGTPETQCEDEQGNVWNLPLEQYQSGLQPQGPCLPVGSWDRMRDRADPNWRRRKQDGIDRDLSALGPEMKRFVSCKRCVQLGECMGADKLRCAELPFVAQHCDQCERRGACKVDRRLGCSTRARPGWADPDGPLLTYRRLVVSTIKEHWANPVRGPELHAKVTFTIETDGTLSDIVLTQSSNDDAFDRGATAAVRSVARLPKPPPGWPPQMQIEFHSIEDGPAG